MAGIHINIVDPAPPPHSPDERQAIRAHGAESAPGRNIPAIEMRRELRIKGDQKIDQIINPALRQGAVETREFRRSRHPQPIPERGCGSLRPRGAATLSDQHPVAITTASAA